MSVPRILEPRLAHLDLSREAVVRECGGVAEALAETLDETIDALLAEADASASPRGGYVLSTERFDTGPIIAGQLAGAERYAVFLATLGTEFDAWQRALFARDPFRGFVANAIGGVAVEATVDRLETVVVEEARTVAASVTNRVSPGYCGWSVADQHRLFRVFPEGFLGVRLTASALMVPIKSVSGLIGIGQGVERHEYPCGVCTVDDCPTRGRGRH